MVDYLFGGGPEDRLTDNSGDGMANSRVGFYLDEGLANRVTDLRLADGSGAVTELTTSQFGYWPQFYTADHPDLWAASLDYAAPARHVVAKNLVAAQAGQPGGLATLDDPAGTVPLGQVPQLPMSKITGLEETSAAGGVIYVDGYGRAAVQAALDAARDAGGGIVVNTNTGDHAFDDILHIHRETSFISVPGVRYVRASGTMTALAILDTNGQGGYGGTYNVEVVGGDWDVNRGQYPAECAGIAFGHAHRVRFADLVIRNIAEWHALGIHGSKHVIVEHCEFINLVSSRAHSEAVQVDSMYGSGAFSHYGPYDNTMCTQLTVRDCTFTDCHEGVGSHNGPDGFTHDDITINDNVFRGTKQLNIHPRQWENVVISGNRIQGGTRAIDFTSEASPPVRHGFRIINNQCRNQNATSDAVIWVEGGTGHWSGVASGNSIDGAPNCDGITLGRDINDWQLSDNTAVVGGAALYTFDGNRIVIDGNRAVEQGAGAKGAIRASAGAADYIISDNHASSVVVENAGNGIVMGNIIGSGANIITNSPGCRTVNNYKGGTWTP